MKTTVTAPHKEERPELLKGCPFSDSFYVWGGSTRETRRPAAYKEMMLKRTVLEVESRQSCNNGQAVNSLLSTAG